MSILKKIQNQAPASAKKHNLAYKGNFSKIGSHDEKNFSAKVKVRNFQIKPFFLDLNLPISMQTNMFMNFYPSLLNVLDKDKKKQAQTTTYTK